METSQTLSIESFSYSWLVNLKPSSLDNSVRASFDASSFDEGSNSFIEMDPRMPPSKRFFIRNSQDFKFDFPNQDSPLTLLHADELFSNGYVMPIFVDPVKIEAPNSSLNLGTTTTTTTTTTTISTTSQAPHHELLVSAARKVRRSSSLRRCRKLSRRILEKYLNFVKPLFQMIQRNNNRSRSNGGPEQSCEKRYRSVTKSRVYSSETSPRISVAYSVDDWRKSCDSDSSIYEAVLHCKRSIGK